MPTLPRTDGFGALAGSIPSDGSSWIPGALIASDKPADEYGRFWVWGVRDYGVQTVDPDVMASAWLAWRHQLSQDDVRVTARLHWRHVSGDRHDVSCGLLARLQASPSVGVGLPERWLAGSCYALEAEIDAETETAGWYLRRYDAGVATELDAVAMPWPEATGYDVELRVFDRDDGGVRVRAFVAGAEILAATDPAISALPGGLVGFLTSDSANTAGRSRAGIREFRVRRYGSGATLFHDDFGRPNQVDATPAYHLRSLWGPFTGLEQTGGLIQAAGADTGRVALYQVRPTDPDYRVTATVEFADTATHWAGLCVRASKATTNGDLAGLTGYLARLRIDTDTENLELLKLVGGVVVDKEKVDAEGLTATTPIALRVDVAGDVKTIVKVRVNGVLLLSYRDEAADRHTRSGQAGVYLLSAGSAGLVTLDDFELKDPPAADDTVILRRFGDERVGIAEQTFVMCDLSSQIVEGSRTFRLPAVPASSTAVALFRNGLRVQRVASDPTALQHSTDVSVPSVFCGFDSSPGDRILADIVRTGNDDIIVGEIPTGTVNGTNKVFALAEAPLAPGAVRVFVHGLRLKYAGTTLTPAADEYSIPSGTAVRVGTAPIAGMQFCVDYLRASASGLNPVFGEAPVGDIDGVNQTFTVATAPNSLVELAPWLNGLRLEPGAGALAGTEYSLAADEFITGANPDGTDWLVADYVPLDAYLEVFDLVPDDPFTPTVRLLTSVERMEYGYEQTFPVMAQPRELYPIRATAVTRAKRDYVIAFLHARTGPHGYFLWLPPDETEEQLVHLADGSIRETKLAPDIYTLELTLERLTVIVD